MAHIDCIIRSRQWHGQFLVHDKNKLMRLTSESPSALPIGTVERETGIPKDTLRVWERRYGFPQPVRDGNGDRLYPQPQVDRLRLIKRLVDRGMRPAKVIVCNDRELLELASQCNQPAPRPEGCEELARCLDHIKQHQGAELKKTLGHQLTRLGLQRFVVDTIAPLTVMIGEAWMRGEIAMFEEHLYSEQVQGLIRHAISSLHFTARRPRVVLTTLPNEQHGLGLLMAEAILACESADVVPLGTQLPLSEIVSAAAAHQTDVVALSFSASYSASAIPKLLADLRAALPGNVAIWAGGSGVQEIRRPPPGVLLMHTLSALEQAVADWRACHGSPTRPRHGP
jgi:DNA-binding transcriptional MerR regulator/methylmalonyl-CoA mutase cobalamin-binding subunit